MLEQHECDSEEYQRTQLSRHTTNLRIDYLLLGADSSRQKLESSHTDTD
jgi:hypothetical protein